MTRAVGRIARPLAASLSCQAMAASTALTSAVLAPAAAPDLGVDPSLAGTFIALLFVAAMVSTVVGGGLARSWGAIRVSQVCLLLCGAGIALAATGKLPQIALSALVIGLGYGPMTPASSHMLVRVTTDRNRPFVFSLKQTSVPIGGMLAGLVAPSLAVALGWRGAGLSVAAACVGLALLLEGWRSRLDADRTREGGWPSAGLTGALLVVLRHARLRELGFTSLAFSAVQLCFGTFFVIVLTSRAGLNLIEAGLALSAGQAAGIAGRILWGAAAERLVASRPLLGLLGVGMALSALATGFLGPGWPLAAIYAISVLFGATAVGWNGIFLAEIARVTRPEETGRATGGALFFTFGGMVAGPALFGLLVTMTGSYGAAFWMLAAAALLPALGFLWPRRQPMAP